MEGADLFNWISKTTYVVLAVILGTAVIAALVTIIYTKIKDNNASENYRKSRELQESKWNAERDQWHSAIGDLIEEQTAKSDSYRQALLAKDAEIQRLSGQINTLQKILTSTDAILNKKIELETLHYNKSDQAIDNEGDIYRLKI